MKKTQKKQKRTPMASFSLNELESRDVKGLVKLAKQLSLTKNSEITAKKDNYLEWERKDAGIRGLRYTLTIKSKQIDYDIYY